MAKIDLEKESDFAETKMLVECHNDYTKKKGYKDGFKDGAEFGYNKANEWSYPSKGELPKDDKDMLMSKPLLLVTKMKGSDCLSLALGQYNFFAQEFSYQHIVGLTDVYAWKEIDLPKFEEA